MGVSAQRRSFTLVELMIVVAIIAVLAAIAIPVYQEFRLRSNASELKVLVGGILQAGQSYCSDHPDYAGSGDPWQPDATPGKALRTLTATAGSDLELFAFHADGLVRGSYQAFGCLNGVPATLHVAAVGAMDLDEDLTYAVNLQYQSSTSIGPKDLITCYDDLCLCGGKYWPPPACY